MSTEDFLRPKMVGKRFDHHSIPLEILGDLAILEEMVIEVAKWCYLKDNPERKRSPRGFTDGVSLRRHRSKKGVPLPVIALSLGTGYLLPPTNRVYFEQAREAIVGAIGAAEAANRSPPICRRRASSISTDWDVAYKEAKPSFSRLKTLKPP